MIEDEAHAEPQGEFDSFDGALKELRRRALVPWDVAPNVAPCTGWQTCRWRYELVQFDTAKSPWREIRRVHVLDVSADSVKWVEPFNSNGAV